MSRRIALRRGVALALLTALIAGVLLLTLAGANNSPPATAAARLVPANALAYLHLSLDQGRSAVQQAAQNGKRIPGYSRLQETLQQRLSAVSGVPFKSGIQPWLGPEAAVAFLPQGSSAQELILLSVHDRAAAERFIATSKAPATKLIGNFVAIGTQPGVRAAQATAANPTGSLAHQTAYKHTAGQEPAGRVLDAYATADGISALLGGRHGVPGAIGALLGGGGPSAIAISPTQNGGQIWAHLGQPAPTSFSPTLAKALPQSTSLLLDTPSLRRTAPELLALMAGGGLDQGLVSLFKDMGKALPSKQARSAVANLFSGEGALFALDGGLGVITRVSQPRQAKLTLASLEPVAAQLFAPGSAGGVVPQIATHAVDNVQVSQLSLGPALTVQYAVFNGYAVVATGTKAVGEIIADRVTLSGSGPYQSVLGGPSKTAGPLMYAAVTQLVRPNQPGLLASAGLSALAPVLDHIKTVGYRATGGKSQTTAELNFTIS
ncbi:MAG: DUF3352 domain-containing protein [Solirubrobacterales bacterium]|nr:DUF3352 domain-containing protein [Solirubrobacterales bacterium]